MISTLSFPAIAADRHADPSSLLDPGFWHQLWSHYLRTFVDSQGRVIDWQRHDVTTSEGQAYALFFALVADQRQQFARILSWTNNNLAHGELGNRLPGWLWGRNTKGRWTLLSPHSAADADLWIAYTLLQAGRLWRISRYTRQGEELTRTIARSEVISVDFSYRRSPRTMSISLTPMLLPGYYGFTLGRDRCVLNPSYLPMPLLFGLAHSDPDGPWRKMASQLPNLLRAISPHGFVPDWVGLDSHNGTFFQPPEGDRGSFNAIRVYLWAGFRVGNRRVNLKVITAIPGMANYLVHHGTPPLTVNVYSGKAEGKGPVGFSAAVLPYLRATRQIHAFRLQMLRLSRSLDPETGLFGNPPHYYDQNLALFALGYLSNIFHFTAAGNLITRWAERGDPGLPRHEITVGAAMKRKLIIAKIGVRAPCIHWRSACAPKANASSIPAEVLSIRCTYLSLWSPPVAEQDINHANYFSIRSKDNPAHRCFKPSHISLWDEL
jgi:endoglucanase